MEEKTRVPYNQATWETYLNIVKVATTAIITFFWCGGVDNVKSLPSVGSKKSNGYQTDRSSHRIGCSTISVALAHKRWSASFFSPCPFDPNSLDIFKLSLCGLIIA
jgi:hypothetical protein